MTLSDTTTTRPTPPARTEWGAFIDGGFVPAGDLPTFEVVEPSTAMVLGTVVSADDDLVDRAVRSALT
jgi:acyl-CoA reductase-like NAD-dependent aldehyde dehydrogenase